MGLQFQPPPDWLVQGYMNRPNPVVEGLQGVQGVMQQYAQQKSAQQQAALAQQAKDIEMAKAIGGPEGQGQDFIDALSKIQNQRNAPQPQGPSLIDRAKAFFTGSQTGKATDVSGGAPASFMPPTQSTGTVPSPGLAQNQVVMQSTMPVSSPTPPGVAVSQGFLTPQGGIDQAAMAEYKRQHGPAGIKSLDTQIGLNEKLQNTASKAEEMGPKSFDYARAFSGNAGAPQAAEGFIKLAQGEGRTTLTKREMDDLKNSIATSAQTGRGQYFGGMLGLNQAKFQNTLLQEGNKALNPNVAGGALKPQQERLNRIGRAEALVQQMASQKGGGDTRQMRELGTSLASVLTGGNVVAEQQINELIPETYKGNAMKFFEKLSNNPTGLEQQAFIARLADTLAREKGTIHTQIHGAQQQAIPGLAILQQTNPKGYKGIVDANVNNPTYQNQPQTTGPHGPTVTQNGHTYTWNGSTYE